MIGAATAVAAMSAAPAQAANPYTPAGVCGGGFHVIDRHNVTGPRGGVLGTAYLLWDGGSKRNCAVMLKRRAVGTPTWAEVSLAKEGGRYKADDGFYSYYAGPLYVRAPGKCVIFGGRMRDAKGNGGSWITPWPVHCR
jgi:sialidase-1